MSRQTIPRARAADIAWWPLLAYFITGVFFGIVLIQSQVVSWYRIQEMFRFQSFHLYGVLASAVLTSAIFLRLAGHLGIRAASGEPIGIPAKRWEPGSRRRYAFGGIIFGLGWALAGTCPGPAYALIGYGSGGAIVVLVSALLGTRAYAALAGRLPH